MVNSEDFSKRLQIIFEHYGLNASAFAEKIDVGRASISHLLSGRNKPSLDFVMRVVKTFPEVELYWLLNGKGSFPKKEKATNAPTSLSHFDSVVDTKSETVQANKNEEDKTSDDIERIVIFYKNGSFKSYKAE
ncbi:helix-turn-helix transcriptional regulator [Flavobacterium sp. CS20]|uniref:helix-turn-helix transcriptional regulator n=1 Tax=Flavobacterium sp. CS20 TaxID=2775246 RepID=UPI001B39EB4C|nr:helix-turn-helix transcriptional regulator [Flavobacterium sp. CS20]QTY27729.1 helix-turn-helix transcriptional regulator [Flavobacterium sp. CS20]